ncbi:uncharacterized protein Pyn_16386 [Prunus yedoensis var. nudiflora]|uniref:Uncharacterized protein n=1 Tax=Prunus yedoensis var. nudiflora TaxID=2094558 RepID=A0A314UZ68_PRUYE|nr:uncharacterized protein Pyn_16386 [Prunus yedoensis var. nudiflora]
MGRGREGSRGLDNTEQIEDAVTGLKVIACEGNCVRLSLRTYIPKLEDLFSPKKVGDATEPSKVNHELLIELLEGVEEIFIAVVCNKSARQNSSMHHEATSGKKMQTNQGETFSLAILVHTLEYLDKDETVVAHVVGGVDAFIKVPQGWPLLSSPLKLIYLKSSDQHSKGISLSFLCNVQVSVHLLISS